VIDRDTRKPASVFFGRLFENEVFSSSRAAASGLIWMLALIATPGVMFSFVMSLHYARCLRSVIAHEGRRTTKMSRAWARLAAMLLRPLLRSPLQRGLAAFMLATLGRGHFTPSTWSLWALQSWRRTAVLIGSLMAVWVVLRLRLVHMAQMRNIRGFVYDETEPARVTLMDLSKLIRES
jgi:hypothetical protein